MLVEIGRHALEGARPVEHARSEPEGVRPRAPDRGVAFVPRAFKKRAGSSTYRINPNADYIGKAASCRFLAFIDNLDSDPSASRLRAAREEALSSAAGGANTGVCNTGGSGR